MKIYLVQHGEAEASEVDPERPLTEQGRSDVQRIASLLERTGIKAERMIHSGKLRARQTAEILAAAVAPGSALETSDQIKPNDDPAAFDLPKKPGDRDAMVVGHLPFMARLVAHLVAGSDAAELVAYRPGSVVCLENIDNTRWQINWMIRPELIA
ncbi:MAG: phosphohistidine phosphatase SixA [Gammaproteobacteria bacterium]|nr:MAG: phosphohistidine phosphatase SixA [Gammaproteobacteria bacterium]